MNNLRIATWFMIIYAIVVFGIIVCAKETDPCVSQDPTLKLIELSNIMKKEAARSYLRLDWNGTSVTAEQYDKMMETNKKHYDEDPNLRMVTP